jgi:hypothetical protein
VEGGRECVAVRLVTVEKRTPSGRYEGRKMEEEGRRRKDEDERWRNELVQKTMLY